MRGEGWRFVAIVALAACGKIGFDPRSDAIAGVTDTATPDPDAPAAACEQAWLTSPTVSTPVPITAANTNGPTDYAPYLSANGLDLYFGSNRSGMFDVYVTSRATLDAPFGTPVPLAMFNSTADDTQVTFGPDERDVFVDTNRAGGSFDILMASRADASAPFPTLTPLYASAGDELNPLLVDERTLYFSGSSLPGSVGMTDLWVSQRAGHGSAFGPPQLVPGLATVDHEASPALISTGRVIVFTSSRPGSPAPLSIWYATRAETTDPFGTPQLVPVINTSQEYTPFLRPDGCELFYNSLQAGSADLYVVRIMP
ncbi:MAG TPA: hypothetical protein VIV11_32145 [Kofleriaceae bacterium]